MPRAFPSAVLRAAPRLARRRAGRRPSPIVDLGPGAAARATSIVVLAVLVAGLGACREPATTATPPPATAPTPAPTPNTTDLAWLQLLLAMNERLVPVLDLATGRTEDPAVARRAKDARAARTAELEQLRRLTTTLPTENPHAGHDMPGMTTADQRAALTRSRGADFDRKLTAAVQAHLDQAIRLCTGEQTAGADPSFRHAARKIREAAESERHRWT